MGIKLRTKTLSDGTKSFYLDINNRGKHWTETLRLYGSRGNMASVKAQAEAIKAKRELELAMAGTEMLHITYKNKSFLEWFWAYSLGYSAKDKRTVVASYNQFWRFIGNSIVIQRVRTKRVPTYSGNKDITFGQLTNQLCHNYRKYLIKTLKGESPANYFSKFKRCLAEAVKAELILKNPAEDITLGKEDGASTETKHVLTPAELEILFSTPCEDERVYKAFYVACRLALRTHEAEQVRECDIVEMNGYKYLKVTQTKGRNPKPKFLPLDEDTLKLIGEYDPKSKEPLFKLPSRHIISKTLREWTKAAGINKKITFYCGRHTVGTNLTAAGVDPITTMAIMGWTSLKYLPRYAKPVNENIIAATEVTKIKTGVL